MDKKIPLKFSAYLWVTLCIAFSLAQGGLPLFFPNIAEKIYSTKIIETEFMRYACGHILAIGFILLLLLRTHDWRYLRYGIILFISDRFLLMLLGLWNLIDQHQYSMMAYTKFISIGFILFVGCIWVYIRHEKRRI